MVVPPDSVYRRGLTMVPRLAPVVCLVIIGVATPELFGQGPMPKRPDPWLVRAEAAKWNCWRWESETYAGRESILGIYRWSRRQAEAEMDLRGGPAQRVIAAESHLTRMRFLQNYVRRLIVNGRAPRGWYFSA